jgi:CDP-diacylglycerol--glycerol-3-phosphate 3-phosphatidyltransferase
MGSELSVTTQPQASPLARFKDQVRERARAIVAPLVAGLTALGVRPLGVTVAGLVLSVLAAMAFLAGAFGWGAVLLAMSGLCDILDGQLARHQGSVSTLGAFLDSTLDRVGEAVVLIGIAGFYIAELVRMANGVTGVLEAELAWGPREHAIVALTAVIALTASFLVSYTRARAEGLGMECKVGWFERPERMVVLIVAAAFGVGVLMPTALVVLAALSFVTAAQRVAHVWMKTRAAGGSPPPGAKQD